MVKQGFYNNQEDHFIPGTSPFESLNIDFKESMPSNTGKSYILIVVDELSRFPYALLCRDLRSSD